MLGTWYALKKRQWFFLFSPEKSHKRVLAFRISLLGVSFFGKGCFLECDPVSGHLYGCFSGLDFESGTSCGPQGGERTPLPYPLAVYQPLSSTAGRQSTASHPSRVSACHFSPHLRPDVRNLFQASDLMLFHKLLYSNVFSSRCA